MKGFNGADLEGNEILYNMFSPHGGAAPVILVYEGPGDIDLKTAESMFPRHFKGNVWKRPIFVSTNPRALRDFDLKPESPGIDAGAFVTTVVGSGKSDRMQVVDAKFFIDGFGLVPGDVIRLQGTSTTARIVGVEHSTNTLRLAEAVSFTAGQGVALNYSGAAPDMGGREYASAAPAPAPLPLPVPIPVPVQMPVRLRRGDSRGRRRCRPWRSFAKTRFRVAAAEGSCLRSNLGGLSRNDCGAGPLRTSAALSESLS